MSKPKMKLGAINKKIESPLAKYNAAGQLTCIVCNTVVKSELVWTAHINGKQHRETVASLKKQKEEPKFAKPATQPATAKRKTDSEISESPSKKAIPADFFDKKQPPKSILKNAPPRPLPSIPQKRVVVSDGMDVDASPSNDLPQDFFDAKATASVKATVPEVPTTSQAMIGAIPEGFFDDPKLDAKVHNKEYKDPVEEEWEKFQKEIQDEITVSVKIQDEDQEESTVERQLEEIEEQLAKWGRVVELERKREELRAKLSDLRNDSKMEDDGSDSSADEAEYEEFFDWRSKAT